MRTWPEFKYFPPRSKEEGEKHTRALLVAIQKKNKDGCYKAFNRGANPFFLDPWGRTILHQAVFYNWSYAIPKFIKLGVSINSTDKQKQTPLSLADTLGHRRCAEVLRQLNADIHMADNRGHKLEGMAEQAHHTECSMPLSPAYDDEPPPLLEPEEI